MAYVAPIYLIPTEHVLGAGTIDVPFQGIMTSRDYAVDFISVPTADGVGNTLVKINSAVRGRHWVPQPFLTYLNEVHLIETTLPDGFVNHEYEIAQLYDGAASVAVISGSLPPGLGLSVLSTSVSVTGTPTTIGSYTFTLRFTVGIVTTDYLYHIEILEDPDQGTGGIGGG